MPRFKQTAEILKLMNKKENIRNIGIIAHIDHGKTTLTDSLLAGAGLLPPSIAGEAKVLDYLEEEQKRGITIKTANISLLHETKGNAYIINLIDTPGHVDFTGKVTRALRAIDSAIVVVDAVEEIMAQTETVTRQALEERVKPVLFINKVDRLIKELKLAPEKIQEKFARIISNFNNLIEIYAEPEFKKKWKVNPAKETVAFGSALHKWGFTLNIARQKEVKFTDIVNAYANDNYEILSRLLPLHHTLLHMIVEKTPNPTEAQKYRLPKIWKGKINSEIGQAMLKCDDKGPTVMCITNAQIDPKTGLVATGRVFSGSVKEGDHVYLVGAKKDYHIKQVFMYMGAFRETVNQITAGNIAALSNLELARAGETLVDIAHKDVMVPFERVKYVSEPVMSIAIEPKNPKELPHLVEAMNRLIIEDPNLAATIDKETGQCLLSGMGELHLEIALKFLEQYSGKMELTASSPIVTYRESILKLSKTVMAKTSNMRNKLFVQVAPLETELVELMEKGELANGMEQKRIGDVAQRVLKQFTEENAKILALNEHGNILIDLTKNVQSIQEIKENIIAGFHWACDTGPLCEEPLRNVKVTLIETQIHEDPTQREPTQIMRAMSRAILGAVLTAKPVLLEPIYKIEVSVPVEWFGTCTSIITRKRGKILASENKGALTIITGYIPVAETFGLSAEMRTATSGRAFWQCTFSHWERVPENMATQIIRQIRERRGLPLEIPKPEKFVEKE
ncbi:MAG: elongation factor EF-2 [Candidatus Bathyarchaeia archaeon]